MSVKVYPAALSISLMRMRTARHQHDAKIGVPSGFVSETALNGAREPSGAWRGDGRINGDFGQQTRDARRRGNVELKWMGIGGCQPHELPAFP
jgi:hypothetical protein